MTSGQETLIYVEENDKAEASAQAKGFAKNSVRNRAYINTLGVELGLKYLASEGINVSNLHNLHSVHKFLEEFDIADIILPNVHIDVRVVFSDKYIFVPKSHFEYGLTPDIYLVFQLSEDQSYVKALGFFKPELINKKDANNDYYFIQKEKLTPVINLKAFIESASNNTTQILDEETVYMSESYFISMVDNDLHDEDKKNLIGALLKSDSLRDRLIEFSNFEILSYKAANDDDLQKTITETSARTPMILTDGDDLPEESADLQNSPENLSQPVDEFEMFDNSHDEFDAMDSTAAPEELPPVIDEENLTPEVSDTTDSTAATEEEIFPEIAEESTNITDNLESHDFSDGEEVSLDEILMPATEDTLQPESETEITEDLIFTEEPAEENTTSENDIEFIDNSQNEPDEAENAMLGYTTPPEYDDSSQELINFDDIDVSVPENIENFRHDDYSANDAVAFDVLEPVSLEVDFDNQDNSNEGNFITALSSEDETSMEKMTMPELKTDIVDEQLTAIGALDTIGLETSEPQEDTTDSDINMTLLDDTPTETAQTEENQLNLDIESLPTTDNMETFDNFNLEENLQPMEESDALLPAGNSEENSINNLEEMSIDNLETSIDNLEELSSTENTVDENPETAVLEPIETGSIDTEDFIPQTETEPVPEIDDLSLTPENLTELGDTQEQGDLENINLDNLQPLDNIDNLDLEQDLSLPAGDDLIPEETLSTEPENLSFDDVLPELNENITLDEPETSAAQDTQGLEPADEVQEDLLHFTEEPLNAQPENTESIVETHEDLLNFAPEESLNLQTDEPETLTGTNEDLLNFAPEATLHLEEDAPQTISDTQDDLLNFAPEESSTLQTENEETPADTIDNLFSFAPEETINAQPDNQEVPEEFKPDELLSFAPEEPENITETPTASEQPSETLSFADDISMNIDSVTENTQKNDASELLSFSDMDEEPSKTNESEDLPFTLIEDNADAPKPMDMEDATLSFDTPVTGIGSAAKNEPKQAPDDIPAELDSKNILAEIDTLLGNGLPDDDDDDNDNDNDDDTKDTIENLDMEAMPEVNQESDSDITDQELTPEETIYMQTMAKEKGKKGMILLLVVVAALLGVFTLTTFIKNGKSTETSDLQPVPEGEIIDTLGNGDMQPPAPETTTPAVKIPETLPAPADEKIAQTPPPAAPGVKKVEPAATASNTVVKGHFYPEIKKITFEIPDYLSYSEGIRKYLQTVGRSVKLSASSDLLLTTDYSSTDRVKVALTLSPSGDVKKADMAISSGSAQIDQIVLQSVKNTLNIVKPPADEVKGDEFNLAIIMSF